MRNTELDFVPTPCLRCPFDAAMPCAIEHACDDTPVAPDSDRSFRISNSEFRIPCGFTLLELALVIALLAMLAAMAIPTFSGAMARHQLAESAEQLRSLMFLARAQAAGGRRLEIQFINPAEENLLAAKLAGEGLGPAYRGVRVIVERDPLSSPGVFDELTADWARWEPPGPEVQIARVQVSEPMPVIGEEAKSFGDKPASGPPRVLFGHDGRSQVGDVSITLVNDRLDGYVVQLRGATGIATVAQMPSEQEQEASE